MNSSWQQFTQMFSDPAYTGTLLTFFVFLLAIIVFCIVVVWKLFKKADEPGWGCLIPVYNVYLLYKISWRNRWIFWLIIALGVGYELCFMKSSGQSGASALGLLALLFGVAELVLQIVTMVKLARAFGKSGGFACGLIFLSLIFMAILAFGDARYIADDSARDRVTD